MDRIPHHCEWERTAVSVEGRSSVALEPHLIYTGRRAGERKGNLEKKKEGGDESGAVFPIAASW